MKKTLPLFLLINFRLFSIIGVNDYLDINLIDKQGVYGYETYQRDNYTFVFGGVDNKGYSEFLGKLHINIAPPELFGFFLVSEILFSYCDVRDTGGEFTKTGDLMLFFGEAYLGYKNKYTTIKFGFQNLISSDAIYNHLIVDDYSGQFFTLKWSQLFSRYVDMEYIYAFVRPHEGSWSQNLGEIYVKNELYGKSLFIKKLNIRPVPWIRIGLSDSVYFMGNNFNFWFINPFSVYFIVMSLEKFYFEKNGGAANTGNSSLKVALDFNIGFDGWRLYGELMVDDSEAFFLMFRYPIFPNRLAFLIGGELRGYLLTKYLKPTKEVDFFLSNLYINFEYTIASKYAYSRDHMNNYEYVREEYKKPYDPRNPINKTELNRYQRTGNFIGFMYGNNADCFDMAIGWRNDLFQTKENTAEYQGDVYYDSFSKKKVIDRLFKIQFHYRHYRLGDERNIIAPYYMNEHYYFDVDPDLDSDGDGDKENDASNRETEFLRVIVEEGNIFDISLYSDIFKVTRFAVGVETKFNFIWQTFNPRSVAEITDFTFRWEIAFSVYWY